VIDREFAGSISTRKLVIETAKFNVLTAYSAKEAIDTLSRFPGVDGAVVDTGIDDIECDELVRKLKEIKPSLPVIAVCGPNPNRCDPADYHLDSFAPAPLLNLLRKLMPEVSAQIERQEEQLHDHPV
jgi:response regulator RpfG family c-di-GMP phosphodiesterase